MEIKKHHRTRVLIAAAAVVVAMSCILIVYAYEQLQTIAIRKCEVSKLLELRTTLQHYEKDMGEFPQMYSRERCNERYASWRIDVVQWLKAGRATKNISEESNRCKYTDGNMFTCSEREDGRGSDVLGLFTADGDWAFKSDLRYRTPLAKYVLIVMHHKNRDWTRAGDIILKKDGSAYYHAPSLMSEPVKLTGCIGIDASGRVTMIK